MPDENNFYPDKPENADDFKKAVAWFGGRELIASLKGTIMYAIYGENIDPRSWMKANIYPNTEEKIRHQKEQEKQKRIEADIKRQIASPDEKTDLFSVKITQAVEDIKKDVQESVPKEINKEWAKKNFDYWEWKRENYKVWEKFSETDFWKNLQSDGQNLNELWFDYIADSGDGQMGVYNVACMCLSDLWLEESEVGASVKFEPPEKPSDKILLPRGAFLFVGGDTAYHASNYETLFERFQNPFRWAFTSVRKFLAENYTLKENPIPDDPKKVKILEKISEELEGSIPAFLNGDLYSDTEPTRPLFGIPANHDYYDGIDGFNRLFRRPPFEDILENMKYTGSRGKQLLQIPTFSREQEASYIAVQLPFNWWFFGIDSENEKLDFRQELFFKQIVEERILKHDQVKMILATPEPTTVFGKRSGDDEKTAVYLKAITTDLRLSQPFLTDGKFLTEKIQPKDENETNPVPENAAQEKVTPQQICRLDLSGDVHHYARYWGENTRNLKTGKFSSANYASVVAGGGGAFFDVTGTLLGKPTDENGNPLEDKKIRGEIPPQRVFPGEKESVDKTADRLFDLWNIRKGGYVQIAGAVVAIIIFYFLHYYSNVSQIDWRNEIFNQTFLRSENINYLAAVVFLFVSAAFVGASIYSFNRLIKKLKEKSLKGRLDIDTDGRIKQMFKKFIPLIFAFAVYLLFLLFAYAQQIVFNLETNSFDGYLLSLILFFHLVISLLFLWLSAEYTNWLAIRFKIVRKYNKKTFTQRLEDPNEPTNWKILKLLGKIARLYSYKYLPANVLVILAIIVLILGINLFGRVPFAVTLADLLFTLTLVGFFVLIVYFAYGIGAAYHKAASGKIWFFLLGLWHAFLQIATPYVLFVYGSWQTILAVLLFVILFNGSAILSYLIRKLFAENKKDSFGNKVANFRLAAQLTKLSHSRWLFLVWIILGAGVVSLPFIFRVREEDKFYQDVDDFVAYLNRYDFYNYLQSLFNTYFNTQLEDFDKYIVILISIAVVGYLGYLLSRVWLSWYLAVSIFFDGHNNEAGGAARIEGFKHILRVKIEDNKLTGYVIGFEDAEPDMRKLDMKLVDKFELTPQSPVKSEDSKKPAMI